MKKFRLLIVAACAALAFTACSEPAPKSRIDVVLQMQEVLEEVRDTESANAAAEKFFALSTTLDAFPETPQADASAAESAVGALLEEARRLEKAEFYQSEALRKALRLSK